MGEAMLRGEGKGKENEVFKGRVFDPRGVGAILAVLTGKVKKTARVAEKSATERVNGGAVEGTKSV